MKRIYVCGLVRHQYTTSCNLVGLDCNFSTTSLFGANVMCDMLLCVIMYYEINGKWHRSPARHNRTIISALYFVILVILFLNIFLLQDVLCVCSLVCTCMCVCASTQTQMLFSTMAHTAQRIIRSQWMPDIKYCYIEDHVIWWLLTFHQSDLFVTLTCTPVIISVSDVLVMCDYLLFTAEFHVYFLLRINWCFVCF